MKALLWKELRQLAPWAALMLAAMSSVTLGSLYSEWYPYELSRVWSQVWVVSVFGPPCVAFVTGVLQAVLEVRRDQWAFLIHRGLSPTQIFLAKAGVGLSVYAVIALVPAIIGVAWCVWHGVDRRALSWYHALPLLANSLAAAAFYFAAALAIVWRGPWYFSRLLPLAAPVLMLSGVVGYTSEITEYVPLQIFLAIEIAVAVYAVAAWGVFVKSGEAPGRSRTANACLSVPIFVALFCGCLCLFALAGAGYELLGHLLQLDTATRLRPMSQYIVNRDGHVLQVMSRMVGDKNGWAEELVGITDLDEPQSNRYAVIVGQSRNSANTLSVLDPLPLATVREGGYSPLFGHVKPETTPRHIIEEIGTTAPSDWMHWTFSSPDGLIYAYRENRSMRNGRTLMKPPILEFVVGPDGFAKENERPMHRFGNLLANSGNPWRQNSQFAWHELFKATGNADRYCLLFDDGLYLIDPAEHIVRPLLVPAPGRKIRCLTRLGDAMAVVYNDSISVHSAKPIIVGSRHDPEMNKKIDVSVDVPDDLQYSFPLPKALARFEEFSFGRLPNRDGIVILPQSGTSTFDLNRVIEMRLDGTIVASRDFRRLDVFPAEGIPPLGAVMAFAPPGLIALLIAGDESQQVVLGAAPGTCLRLFRAWPLGMLIPLAVLVGSSLFCFWSAGRTARRYGLDRRTRRVWQWTAALLGPAGLLTLWFLRDWPAFEKCLACPNRRPVDRDVCPRCGAHSTSPPADGTEIIVSVPMLV